MICFAYLRSLGCARSSGVPLPHSPSGHSPPVSMVGSRDDRVFLVIYRELWTDDQIPETGAIEMPIPKTGDGGTAPSPELIPHEFRRTTNGSSPFVVRPEFAGPVHGKLRGFLHHARAHAPKEDRSKRPAGPNETVHHFVGSPGRTRPIIRIRPTFRLMVNSHERGYGGCALRRFTASRDYGAWLPALHRDCAAPRHRPG
jgi:hypothetical protein